MPADEVIGTAQPSNRAKGLMCGFCYGWKPGEPQPPIATDDASQCPCCGQYAQTLYDGSCTAHHEGYGSQRHLPKRQPTINEFLFGTGSEN